MGIYNRTQTKAFDAKWTTKEIRAHLLGNHQIIMTVLMLPQETIIIAQLKTMNERLVATADAAIAYRPRAPRRNGGGSRRHGRQEEEGSTVRGRCVTCVNRSWSNGFGHV